MCWSAHYGSQNFRGLHKKKMFLIEAVFILICCCALLKFISNMQYIIIYFKMILPENEFSLLKGVNNQPYLDIWTSASHLTKRFLFFCISLFFLLSYVFYIHPIGHFRVAFLPLCQKESKCETIHVICTGCRFISRLSNSFLFERFHTKTQGYIHPWAAHRSLWLFHLLKLLKAKLLWTLCCTCDKIMLRLYRH